MSERIQKFLATLGVASRREIERMIDEGRILVNGRPATAGQQIDQRDAVKLDGRPIAMQRKIEAARLLVYKKRTGELVTRDDPEGRRTVFRKLPKLASGRWIAVGRLDINTSGLLLFTNHGELARRLTHPSFEIPRTYAVRVLGTVDDAVIARWKTGVELEDGRAHFERVEAGENEDGEGANQWFHVTVREGRNRLVRRLIESQQLQVSRLIRISYGPIELGRGIKSGTAREATPAEMLAVLDAVGLSEADVGIEPARKPGRGRSARPSSGKAASASPGRRLYDDDDDDFPPRTKRGRGGFPGRTPAAAPRPPARGGRNTRTDAGTDAAGDARPPRAERSGQGQAQTAGRVPPAKSASSKSAPRDAAKAGPNPAPRPLRPGSSARPSAHRAAAPRKSRPKPTRRG
jgi:pseudouridine synthase